MILLLFLGIVQGIDLSYGEYKAKYSKVVPSHEEAYRANLYNKRVREVNIHNSLGYSWKSGLNQFTDRSPSEFKQILGNKVQLRQSDGKSSLKTMKPLKATPDKFDWRDSGTVTPVKNQGMCGSCWAFSAAESIESQYMIQTGKLIELSEQEILDCTNIPGAGGCAGGTEQYAYQMIMERKGLSGEWTYPYTSFFGEAGYCNKTRSKPLVNVHGYEELSINDYDALVGGLILNGPISISVDATDWDAYESGIFNGCNKTAIDINHAVQLVGVGVDASGVGYWIIRNSWGANWGEDGYIRLIREGNYTCAPIVGSKSEACGPCGILYSGLYPLI